MSNHYNKRSASPPTTTTNISALVPLKKTKSVCFRSGQANSKAAQRRSRVPHSNSNYEIQQLHHINQDGVTHSLQQTKTTTSASFTKILMVYQHQNPPTLAKQQTPLPPQAAFSRTPLSTLKPTYSGGTPRCSMQPRDASSRCMARGPYSAHTAHISFQAVNMCIRTCFQEGYANG